MNNLEFWNAIKKFDEHKNPYEKELVCDRIVIEGLGQTKGGYFETACEPRYNKQVIREKAEPSQQFHFFSYYIDYIDPNMNRSEKMPNMNRSEKMPTYANLKCPQLIMYVAEMAGLDAKFVDKAFNFLKDFEEKRGLKETEKGATYLEKIEGNPSEVFKDILHISEIQTIITKSSSYEEIVGKVSLLG